MNQPVHLENLFADPRNAQPLALFALLNLGIIESLACGTLGPTEALRLFYHADNCCFVRRHLRDKQADRLMSHGVQLPDLFAALSPEEAHRQFHHELTTMRALCLQLLEKEQVVA